MAIAVCTFPYFLVIDCGRLTAPEGGQIMLIPGVAVTTDTGLNAVATYSCDEGYNINGDQTRTCQGSGERTGATPTCICKFFIVYFTLKSHEIYLSAAIDCGNLIAPEGGQVTFTSGVVMTLETGLDAVASYTCSVGYYLVGDALRICQANEQWDGAEPNCLRK